MSSSSSASSFFSALLAAGVDEEEDPNPPNENPPVAGGAAKADVPEPADDDEVPNENGDDAAVGLLVSDEAPKENPELGAGAGLEEAAAPKLNRDDLLSLSLSDFFSAAAGEGSLVDGAGAPKAFPNKGLGVTSFSLSV